MSHLSNVQRILLLKARLEEWNALPLEERTRQLEEGGGITLCSQDFAALLDIVVGIVQRLA